MLLVLLLFAALGYYFTTPEERALFFRRVAASCRSALDLFARFRLRADDPFYAELRARAGWPWVTCGLLAINLFMLGMLVGADAFADPERLVAWGANVGPRTTNGERWRLLTSLFVHGSLVHLLVNVVALAQLGSVVERVTGRWPFVTVYLTAGVLGGVAAVTRAPLAVSSGATCAVFGLYGLLLAAVLRGWLRTADVAIPIRALKTLVPGAVMFLAYAVASEGTDVAARIGLCSGFTGGIVLTRRVADHAVRLRRAAALTAATALILFLAVMAVRVVADVRPELAALVSLESQTSVAYERAIARFRNGDLTSRALARVIEQTILPELQRALVHVRELDHVPPAHAGLVAEAEEYLRLRQESWRLRAEALRGGGISRGLRTADRTEHASLQVLERVKAAVVQ